MADNRNYFGPIRGFIYEKGETRTFPTPRGEFKVRNMKIEFKEEGRDGKEYSTIPEMSLINDMCHVLDYSGHNVGAPVDVWFSLSGREMKWKDKVTGEDKSAWKTEVKCHKLKLIETQPQPQQGMEIKADSIGIPPENQAMINEAVGANFNPSTDDDSEGLPF
jgi:hypothetical protein